MNMIYGRYRDQKLKPYEQRYLQHYVIEDYPRASLISKSCRYIFSWRVDRTGYHSVTFHVEGILQYWLIWIQDLTLVHYAIWSLVFNHLTQWSSTDGASSYHTTTANFLVIGEQHIKFRKYVTPTIHRKYDFRLTLTLDERWRVWMKAKGSYGG